MKTYLSVYLGSTFLALLITPTVISVARRLGIADVPGTRHVHVKPISRIGGIAIFLSTMCLSLSVLFLSNVIGNAFRDTRPELIVLLSTAAFLFFVGLIDDIRTGGLRVRVKFLAQIAAAIAVCAVGIRIESVAVADWFTIDFGWFSWPLTMLWIVGITNAINLSDGLDGLAAGISAVACGVIAVFAIHSGNVVMAVLMLAVLGSLTGFLLFNFNPARIFMGDCGSTFLGFTIASSSVLCSMKSSAMVGLALPVLALGVPIFDTLFSMLRRFLERRSMFAPDRRHFHHRLIELGLKQRHVVIIIYVMTLLSAGLGMFMMVTRDISALVIFLCILLLLLLAFRVVGSVRLRETIAGIRKRHVVGREIHKEIGGFQDAELLFRRAMTFSEWWDAVSSAALQLGFSSLSLSRTNRDGSSQTLTWHHDGEHTGKDDGLLKVNVPVRDRRAGARLNFEIEASKNGSLESAGRRIALFTRLVEEHAIVNLLGNGRNSPSDSRNRTTTEQRT
jgi:UDP-GlcNAc:undecaprenyl-phosphate GlcNAc-1-phosphate transferase